MSESGNPSGGQGKLAQVIATRGGTAPPEAPFVIEHREALIYMLCVAAELEHGIMCQYLFAAFSLKQSADEGLSEEQLEAVGRWRRVISRVATEEMLHLALVHNLLSAIGAAPHFSRPNLPAPAHHYPAGVNLALVPFGESALRHFMFLERPEGMALRGSKELDRALEYSRPLMAEGDIVPQAQDFATVGHLYRSIEQGIAHLAGKFGERGLFVGPPRAQATSKDFTWPELVAVTDLASAQKAIDTILEQGEGARGDWQDAHFGRFVQILDEYWHMTRADSSFDPVRPVMHAKVRRGERDVDFPLIGDEVTRRCTDLFNVGYEILLQAFERYFAHTEETDEQLSTLAQATVSLMVRVLGPLGELVTTLPVGPEYPGLNAGPSFELFYETDYLMPHREAAWALLEERLRDACVFCGALEGDAGSALRERLARVSQAFDDIADSLAAHFADWGGTSRYAAPAPAAAEEDRAAVQDRADELAAAIGESKGAARALFGGAHRLVETEPALAGALVESVLRPLAAALAAGTGDAIGPDAPVDAEAGSLWELAQTATGLRAAVPAGSSVEAPLAEATACLQRLALEQADGTDQAAARLARLRELQAAVPEQIAVAEDGPYLVTGAARVANWLGEEIAVPPQAALCRCGASQSKPFCDGSHARTGFSGEKDPNRVPDRRDTYPGQQVTIFDNRGICQHAGFCSDRLATAFRAGEEPFVAPSGGRMDELIRVVRACPSGALSYGLDGVEERSDVDYHGTRDPGIEVTKDGPYRVTGGVPLRDARGEDVPRAQGSSREHYALCRCGHSQNKPFCSGMHWYIDFHDPVPDSAQAPTLFEWCGGLPALTRMTRLFYEKHVPQDPLLAPLFANMSPDHPERVARWLGEVFGGPPAYSENYGGYDRMISQHMGKALTEEARARWVELISRSAVEAGLPADPEFQAAFRAYLEWGSRIALENSQPGAKPPPQMPMPRWWWACDATPASRVSAIATEEELAVSDVNLPGPDEAVGFEQHIKPLFRERDRKSMMFAFDLWSYDAVRDNASGILEYVKAGRMPCDGAWPPEWVAVLERWTESGMAA